MERVWRSKHHSIDLLIRWTYRSFALHFLCNAAQEHRTLQGGTMFRTAYSGICQHAQEVMKQVVVDAHVMHSNVHQQQCSPAVRRQKMERDPGVDRK